MKQKIYIAALLAGMLALAGCGGGSGSTPEPKCPDGQTGTPPDCKAAMMDDDKSSPGLVAADVKAAIEDYEPKADRPASLLSGEPTIKVESGDVKVTLRQSNGQQLTSKNAAFPVSGWSGDSFEFDHGDYGKQAGTVISNIKAPTSTGRTYDLYFKDEDGGDDDGPGIKTGISATGGSGLNDEGSLTLASSLTTAAYFKDVVATKDTTRNIAADGSLKGKFSGVDGTYKCGSGTDCTIRISGVDDKGITITGTLTFEPTLAEGAELSSIFVEGTPKDDDDYLWFGYWMSGSDHDIYTDAGEMGYQPSTYANTSNVTATYKGASGGYYTHDTNAGEFAAKASLTAVFGTGGANTEAAAGSAHNGITGTISDFVATSGGADISSWKLTLGKASTMNGETRTQFASTTVSGVTTSPDAAAGKWSASFHALDTADDADGTPDAVTGQFTGNFGAGSHVAGAFAAELDE